MNKRLLDHISTCIIAASVLFLSFFAIAIKTTLITEEGSSLNQGYIGNANLNILAVVALIALFISVLINRKFAKQSKSTQIIRKTGLLVILLAGLWFLIVLIMVVYQFNSGHFLENWQF